MQIFTRIKLWWSEIWVWEVSVMTLVEMIYKQVELIAEVRKIMEKYLSFGKENDNE